MTAEQSIIGCAILDASCIPIICGELTVDDFTTTANVELFRTIQSLALSGMAVDLVTIVNDLDSRNALERAGGLETITDVLTGTPTSANLRTYIELVQDARRRRIVLSGLQRVTELIESGEDNFIETNRAILDEASSIGSTQTHMLSEHLPEAFYRLGDKSRGRSTGFGLLDHMSGGLQDGHLVIIGARPAVGKTALACNMAANMCRQGMTCAFFSVEMSGVEIAERITMSEAMLNKREEMKPSDMQTIMDAQEKIAGWKFFVDDRGSLSVGQIISSCYRFKQRAGKIDAVFIDYLQLLRIATTKNGNRAQELGAASRALKILAKEIKCPVVALSQLNRDSNGRTPTIADLRESGAIEQDADLILLLHRTEENPNETSVIIGKNRHGETGTVNMVWYPQYTRFFEPAMKDVNVPKGVFKE